MDEPQMGSRVHVWPRAGLAVATGGGTRSFLTASGEDVTWDEWWHRRFRDGSISLHDPTPAAAPVAPAQIKAPAAPVKE